MSELLHALKIYFPRGDFLLDVDIIWESRVTVLFGSSGSGKSTLMEVILGLHPKAESRIKISGESLEDSHRDFRVPVHQRKLGWVPQNASLFPHLNVRENIRFGQERAGRNFQELSEKAVEILELEPLLQRQPHTLSGGERQRVALARALSSGPRVLLLDEPLASLDRPLRKRVLPFFLRVKESFQLPMIYITHDPEEALVLGDTALVMDQGKVVAKGPTRETLWSHAVLPLSESLGLENVIQARVEKSGPGETEVVTHGGMKLVIPGEHPVGMMLRLGIRSQDILLATEEPGPLSARNVMEATVTGCDVTSEGAHLHLDASEPLVAKANASTVNLMGLHPHARVFVIIKSQAVHRLDEDHPFEGG